MWRGWTMCTETSELPTSWWEITWFAKWLILVWLASLRITNILPGKVRPKVDSGVVPVCELWAHQPKNEIFFRDSCLLFWGTTVESMIMKLQALMFVAVLYVLKWHHFNLLMTSSCFRSQVSHQVDCSRSGSVRSLHHQIWRLVIRDPADWTGH